MAAGRSNNKKMNKFLHRGIVKKVKSAASHDGKQRSFIVFNYFSLFISAFTSAVTSFAQSVADVRYAARYVHLCKTYPPFLAYILYGSHYLGHDRLHLLLLSFLQSLLVVLQSLLIFLEQLLQ